MQVRVTRGAKRLPIASVSNLQPGDRIWIHPDFPPGESVHYVLIVAFLRGSTNPPPEKWFTRAETWHKPAGTEGITVTVPQGAQQVLLFLAPDTGGGFTTLRTAVRSKPGAFVRASQDLNQAALDRLRLDTYLAAVRRIADSDPAALHEKTAVLARTLNIKLEQQCFDKPTEQQGPCLMQGNEQLVMDDPHSQTLVASLTSGPSSDIIDAISSRTSSSGVSYSPYVGAVMDLARLLGSMHTAEYQYIPALALPKHEQLNLRLNNPPSFHKPKSVLVVSLPAVEAAEMPALHAAGAEQVYCLEKPLLTLPAEGAPLAFSTELAHDLVLHIPGITSSGVNLPAKADPALGGFVVDTHELTSPPPGTEIDGILQGYWGFEPLQGPHYHLRAAHSGKWTIPAADQTALIAGREGVVHLKSNCAACVQNVSVQDAQGKELKVAWKLLKPDELELHIPLKDEPAGTLRASVKQYGLAAPDEVPLRSYAEPALLNHFAIYAGDLRGILEGTRLDEVASVELNGTRYIPGGLTHSGGHDELLVASPKAPLAELQPEETVTAHVALKDGRTLDLNTVVERPRPKVLLLSKRIQPGATSSPIRYGSQDELPLDGRISFLLRTEMPQKFSRAEKIEIATEDESFDALLSAAAGNLVPQDSRTLLAVFEPLKGFGPDAFGPLRIRAVDRSGAKGDWQPLARLVRAPSLKEVRCPDAPDQPCKLYGASLFLLDSVASDAQFAHSVSVPLGFMDPSLTVPRPNGTLLYIKLRDDPATVDTLVLPVLPEQP